MSTALRRPVVVSALATGALWVVTGWVGFALAQSGGTVSRVASIIPATVPRSLWSWPAAWAVVTIALGTAGVIVWYALYLSVARRRDAASVDLVTAWFAVIAAAATIGFAIDVTVVIGAVPLVGLLAFTSGYGGSAAVGAFWGLIAGWMPALLASRMRRAAEPAVPRRAWLGLAAAVTLVAFIAAGVFGYQAFRIQIAEEAALAQGVTPDDGALPDPYAQGDPVPTAAPASEDLAGVTCTPEQATLLLGEQDAATGHRVLSIRLMNFSEEPCVIEGYIDVAFGDQNEHELAVTIEPGSSFMAADPGPQRIEVPAGGHAIAYLGWDAASPHGALVARSLHAAPIAGMTRGSWPVETDIVEGSTVEVTAWQLEGSPASD